jgi:hypothetical protein
MNEAPAVPACHDSVDIQPKGSQSMVSNLYVEPTGYVAEKLLVLSRRKL